MTRSTIRYILCASPVLILIYMFIANFMIGLIIIVLGVAGLRFNYQLVKTFGRNNVFERKLGSGSTYPVFQLFAILVIFAGFLTMFSLHDNILDFIFAPIINVFGGNS